MKHVKLFEEFINEGSNISQDGYVLNRLADDQVGGVPATEFQEEHNLDLQALTRAIVHTKEITKYELRDIIKGTAPKSKIKKFLKEYVKKMENVRRDLLESSYEMNEMNLDGYGNDPKKPKAIDKVEIRVANWRDSLKKGWTPTTQYSPKLAKLRKQWEDAIEKYKDEWQPKYNFGDLLA